MHTFIICIYIYIYICAYICLNLVNVIVAETSPHNSCILLMQTATSTSFMTIYSISGRLFIFSSDNFSFICIHVYIYILG